MNNIDLAKGITDNYKALSNAVGGFSSNQKKKILRMAFNNLKHSSALDQDDAEQIYGFISRNLNLDF